MNRAMHRVSPALLALAVGFDAPAFAQALEGAPHAATLLAPLNAGTIYLRSGPIDTGDSPVRLAAVAGLGAGGQRHLMQLDGPMTPERRMRIEAAGIVVGEYYPAHAYIVRLDGADPAAAGALEFVRWVSPVNVAWKVAPEAGPATALIVTLYRDADGVAAAGAIAAMPGVRVWWTERIGGSWTMAVEAPAGSAGRLAAIGSVAYVEPAPEVAHRNVDTRWIVQSNIKDQTPLYDRGLRGEGQIVGVLDDKLDVNHCSFKDNQPIGPDHRKIVAYNTQLGVGGHGTHVCGIAVGDGGDFGETRGVAYLGRLCYNGIPSFNESSVHAALSLHHDQGARVHTNSWGNDGTKQYDSLCRGFDAFQYDHEESLVVLAVTNAGDLRNPENAKNLLAVGGSYDYPDQSDHCTGGIGPTTDGRRKPEIYAPGCDILSSQAGTQCNVVSFSGTSMATPAIAGTGLLIRQYFTDGFYPTGTVREGDGFVPTGALIKAMLINSAADMTGVPGYPSDREGWGRVLADDALYFAGEARRLIVSDVRNADGLSTGLSADLPVAVTGGQEDLRVTLTWIDPPASAGAQFAAINDLDLEVISPDGTLYKGNVFSGGFSTPGGSKDDRNNLEQVHIAAPSPGQWSVRIVGAGVNEGLQGYSVAVTGEVDSGPAGLSISLAGPVPDFVDPGTVFTVEAVIDPGDDELVPGSPMLFFRTDGGEFQSAALVDIGGGHYSANLPLVSCKDAPEFYVSAEGAEGGVKTAPFGAPANHYALTVGSLQVEQVAAFGFGAGLPDGWTAGGLWHASSACTPSGACDGGGFMYYGKDAGCTYQTGSGTMAAAPIVLPELPPGGSITMTYCSALLTEDFGGFDTAELTANNNLVDTAGESASWQQRKVDLTALAGQAVTLRWVFDTVDDQFNDYRGWHVDGVEITATKLVCEDGCYGDYNGDGTLDFFDFLAYTNAFNAGDNRADCDGTGLLDFFDFLCFQNAFVKGC